MKVCSSCGQRLRDKEFMEHWYRFHAPPRKNKDGSIQLNACDQICIMIKSWTGNWKKFIKITKNEEDKQRAIKLEDYEKQNHIKFKYSKKRDTMYYLCVKKTVEKVGITK